MHPSLLEQSSTLQARLPAYPKKSPSSAVVAMAPAQRLRTGFSNAELARPLDILSRECSRFGTWGFMLVALFSKVGSGRLASTLGSELGATSLELEGTMASQFRAGSPVALNLGLLSLDLGYIEA